MRKNFIVMGIVLLVLLGLVMMGSFYEKTYRNKASNNKSNETIESSKVPKEKIYTTVTSSYMFINDPANYKSLINDDTLVAKIKVLSFDKSIYLEGSSLGSINNVATPVNIEILEVIKGKQPESNQMKIYKSGGEILITEAMKKMDKERIIKMGLDNISKQDQKSLYISYTSEYDYELKENEIYALILNKNADKYELFSGFSVFKTENQEKASKKGATKTDLTIFKNALSDKELILD